MVDDPTLSGIHATMLRLFSGVDQDGIKMGWGCRENLISMVEIRPQKNGIKTVGKIGNKRGFVGWG